MYVRLASARLAAVTMPVSALAHEGHGDPAWYGSLLHFLLEPAHLPVTLAALVALVLALRWRSELLARPARARRR